MGNRTMRPGKSTNVLASFKNRARYPAPDALQFNPISALSAVVVAGYFVLPERFRWMFLLAASYYFYMCWRVEYIVLILASTITDYLCALAMGKHETRAGRRKWLLLSLFLNLGLLGVFKYGNFAIGNLNTLFAQVNITTQLPELGLLLPVGISFYTFQTLSYSIDVYRGTRAPERHLGIFALYVAFFPQLVAGPIERSARLLPQFHQRVSWDYDRFRMGVLLILAGYFQKLVIADQVAPYVDAVYSNPACTHRVRRCSRPISSRSRSSATSRATPASRSALRRSWATNS